MVELIPIEHVNSVKTKVEGSYTVQNPGNYVLVFGVYALTCWLHKLTIYR